MVIGAFLRCLGGLIAKLGGFSVAHTLKFVLKMKGLLMTYEEQKLATKILLFAFGLGVVSAYFVNIVAEMIAKLS